MVEMEVFEILQPGASPTHKSKYDPNNFKSAVVVVCAGDQEILNESGRREVCTKCRE